MTDARGRETRGVVASVEPERVMVVSFTGSRIRHSPSTFRALWSFVQAPPTTMLRCDRGGCREQAVFLVQRDSLDYYMCPRHIPSGIASTYMAGLPPGVRLAQPTVVEVVCPSCASTDPTEDLNLPRPAHAAWSWWACPMCGRSWVTIGAPPSDRQDPKGIADWYQSEMADALTVAKTLGGIDRIEAGSQALLCIPHRANQGKDPPVQLSTTLPSTSIMIVMQERVYSRYRATNPSGVRRLGGNPGRDTIRPSVHPADTLLSLLQPTADLQAETTPPEGAPTEQAAAEPVSTLPVRSKWRRMGGAERVEVLGQEGAPPNVMIRFTREGDTLPVLLPLALFTSAYSPLEGPGSETAVRFEELVMGEEWVSPTEGPIKVLSKNERRQTVSFERADRTRLVLGSTDLLLLSRVVRRSAYERLLKRRV